MRALKRLGIFAIALVILLFAIAATPASANTRVYASDVKIIDWFHIGLIYNVPYNAVYDPYIGGVDQSTVDRYVSADHKNVQSWEWRYYSPGKSALLIPKTYILHRWNFKSEIYLEFLSGQV